MGESGAWTTELLVMVVMTSNYERMAKRIGDAIKFMETIGIPTDSNHSTKERPEVHSKGEVKTKTERQKIELLHPELEGHDIPEKGCRRGETLKKDPQKRPQNKTDEEEKPPHGIYP